MDNLFMLSPPGGLNKKTAGEVRLRQATIKRDGP